MTFPRKLIMVLGVLALLTTACGGDSDDTDASGAEADAAATAAPSADEPSPYAAIMTNVFNGFAKEAGEQSFNWVLGSFGMSAGNGLGPIEDELAAIDAELVQIDETLAKIDTDLLQQTCDATYDAIQSDIERITLLWEDYQTLLGWNASTKEFSNPPNTDTGDMDAWVAEASGQSDSQNPGESVKTALTDVQTALDTGASGAQSTITACIEAIGAKTDGSGLPAPGDMDDRTYYGGVVQPILDYYYGYQVQALTMYINMTNYQAWKADGSPTGDPSTVQSTVCPSADTSTTTTSSDAPGDDSPAYLCEQAFNEAVTAQEAIQSQWAAAGAPYSTDDVQILNGAGTLWPLDLSAFSGGAGCDATLPSWPACGPTVGTYEAVTKIDTTYGAYSSWTAATADQLGALINPDKVPGSSQDGFTSGTLADWLNGRGFTVGSWVILTPEDTGKDVSYGGYETEENTRDGSETVKKNKSTVGICFAATGLDHSTASTQPFCNGGWGSFEQLATQAGKACKGDKKSDIYPACYLSSTDFGGFFDLHYDGKATKLKTKAGWMEANKSPAASYHYPVLDVTTLTCSDEAPQGASATNPAGVPSMCGDDLVTYLDAQVPGPTASS